MPASRLNGAIDCLENLSHNRWYQNQESDGIIETEECGSWRLSDMRKSHHRPKSSASTRRAWGSRGDGADGLVRDNLSHR